MHYPIAMEGALKLKEISYIHAEAYPAGELKHGPLALVDAEMPVVVVTPNDELLEKLHSNMQEVKARGGKLYVFAHQGAKLEDDSNDVVVEMDCETRWTTPILSTIPLQLLSYYVAVQRGTDVDQPRNLAKYTHRIAISNRRIIDINNDQVRFNYKDYRDDKHKVMTLDSGEFIRRFLMHVLPKGFTALSHPVTAALVRPCTSCVSVTTAY